jgi:plastocyanin
MHLAALQTALATVLAAEKSKVPLYIAGGVLVLWALVVSLGLGLRKPNFPASLRGQRLVSAISAVLVAATVATAVLISGTPAGHANVTKLTHVALAGAPIPSAPAVGPGASSGARSAAAASASTSEPPASVGSGGHALSLAANAAGQLAYNTKTLSAKAGKVTITMTNMSPLEHNMTIAEGSKVLGATPTFKGGARSLTLTLKPGKYVFYCSVPGHRAAGMEGTLTVSS